MDLIDRRILLVVYLVSVSIGIFERHCPFRVVAFWLGPITALFGMSAIIGLVMAKATRHVEPYKAESYIDFAIECCTVILKIVMIESIMLIAFAYIML